MQENVKIDRAVTQRPERAMYSRESKKKAEPSRSAGSSVSRSAAQGPALDRMTPTAAQSLQSSVGNQRLGRAIAQPSTVQRASGSKHSSKSKRLPWVDDRGGSDEGFYANDSGSARSDGIVLSGHGHWDERDGYFRVPSGTTLHFYTNHGQTIPDDLGGSVERGRERRGNVEQGLHTGASRVIRGGHTTQNYTISYPSGLNINGSPALLRRSGTGGYGVEINPGHGYGPSGSQPTTFRVSSLTSSRLAGHTLAFAESVRLSELLRPNMGDVHFAACRFVQTGRDTTRNQDEGLYNP
jgi:hypothetical protein